MMISRRCTGFEEKPQAFHYKEYHVVSVLMDPDGKDVKGL